MRTAGVFKLAHILTVITAIGVVAGVALSVFIGQAEYMRISANIAIAVLIDNAGRDTFYEAVIKYGKIPVVIWFSAFVNPGAIVPPVLLFVKGVGVGFVIGLFVRCYGLTGILYSVILYCIQNFFIIPSYIYLSHESLNFAMLPDGVKGSKINKYSFSLIITLFCSILAAFIEAFCIPLFLGFIA